MPEAPYLLRLTSRIWSGLANLDEDRKARHRSFVLSQQAADGGFRGREGDSDIYYTSFAVRCLTLVDGLKPDVCDGIASFLKSHAPERLNVIDLVSWLSSSMLVQASAILDGSETSWLPAADQLANQLEQTRTADGGYAKSVEGASGSTYHSFLVAVTHELLGKPLPNPKGMAEFVLSRQRDDGGFVEIGPMKRSGTNPTAAAAALLLMLGLMNAEIRRNIKFFLTDVRSSEGGFQANTRIPFADGLSTFTALLTAQDLKLNEVADHDRIETFVTEWLEFPTGGFRAASWDEHADVEYTFYGLGILGLIGSHAELPHERE